MSRAADLSRRLADRVDEVVGTYLSNGRRSGNYWLAGDFRNAKGRSLWVRLRGPRDLVGRWRDEAEEGAYGDLLDLICMNGGFSEMSDAMAEAERFLALPQRRYEDNDHIQTSAADNIAAARRLFARGVPVAGTLGEDYLKSRRLALPTSRAMRFHPYAMYIDEDDGRQAGPALLSAIRDCAGEIKGVHRTWIAQDDAGPKVLLRKIMGSAREHSVHLGGAGNIAIVGEGIETVWSLNGVLNGVRLYAALSAAKLALWRPPDDITRVYVTVDRDGNGAGEAAANRLLERAAAASLPALPLYPRLGDFNDDLRAHGQESLKSLILRQSFQWGDDRALSPDSCRGEESVLKMR